MAHPDRGREARTPLDALEHHFLETIAALQPASRSGDLREPVRDASTLTGARLLGIFHSQLASRHLDLEAHRLRARGLGYYTIGSAGHESNAAVAAAARPSDPALLHYRSGGFYMERASQVPGTTPLRDVLLGMVAAVDEPIAGGRHKVFGNAALSIIPQTSTIASHLPRAVGVAFAIDRAVRLGVDLTWPADAIALCSFGDASANHSTAVGAINTACHCAHQRLPLPLLLVCEDNGIGISVRTPRDWIHAAYSNRPGLAYFSADGFDAGEVFDATSEAADHVRVRRAPAFVHLRTVRYGGHAGTDVESVYRSAEEIRSDLRRDPLLGTAQQLIALGLLTPAEVLAAYEDTGRQVHDVAEEAATHTQHTSKASVMAPLAPRNRERVARLACEAPPPTARRNFFENRLPEDEGPLTLAQSVNRTLGDLLVGQRELIIFGEDVAAKGGVYGVTRGLLRRAGVRRVFDTLLDEQSILGLALGAGLSGLLPVAEIQYLAYLHNAEDQLRGEAATLSFFSNGQYHNPMVVRVAGYGYQKGFGGHFHNDNAVAVLRDIPGLVIASPARPEDAAAMLRTCVAAARSDGSVCVFIEPIAMYHTGDLYEPGDGRWLAPYASPSRWAETHVAVGAGRLHGAGTDLSMITSGNGLFMSLRVARRLAASGLHVQVLDLRWLAPLPIDDIARSAAATGRVLVVDETRRSGGISEGVVAALVDGGYRGALARVTSEDSFVPLGDAALTVLLGEDAIEDAARKMIADH